MNTPRTQSGRRRIARRTAVLAAVLLGGVEGALAAQVAWTQFPNLESRQAATLAYDSARQRVVLFGGYGSSNRPLSDTWEWDGTAWFQCFPATSPSARVGHVLAYDAARARTVLFGGFGGTGLTDTWEWDGSDWVQRFPAVSPPVLRHTVCTYDSFRNRVVVYGDRVVGVQVTSETWEWDATIWRQVHQNVPPAGNGTALAFDAARGVSVLLLSDFAQTWEWDGTSWTQRLPAARPSQRFGHVLSWDSVRRHVLLFGGWDGNGVLADTWEWDPAWNNGQGTWVQLAPAHVPPARAWHALASDSVRGRIVLLDGSLSGQYGAVHPMSVSDTWEWDGTDWLTRSPLQNNPPARHDHAMVYDVARDRVVLFGGLVTGIGVHSDTWEWTGREWEQRTSATSPGNRVGFAMAFDTARGRTVLFGGRTSSTPLTSETWEWDGTNWLLRSPATRPPARYFPALAYDSGRSRVVMFGGWNASSQAFSDTWEWDGNDWLQRVPATRPPARGDHAMAYDSARGSVVLFGGINPLVTYYGDTWEWDGIDWVRRTPGASPSPRAPLALAYDAARGRTVLFGGRYGPHLSDTWEWDGAQWLQRTPAGGIPGREGHAMAYDSTRGRVLLFGGEIAWPERGAIPTSELWSYQPANSADYAPFGSGCPGSAGTPVLAPAPGQLPWIGDSFRLQLTNLAPGNFSFLFLGLSRTAWGTLPLPIDLGSIRMPGCALFASGEVQIPVPNGGGSASVTFNLCNCAELVGASFYNQALVLDPAANALGATMTNAGVGRIGAR